MEQPESGFETAARADQVAFVGIGGRQVRSHRAPGQSRKQHALGRKPSALPAMPSHSTLHPRPGVGSLGAHVGPLSSPCDAAARGADRAGHLRARRYHVGLRSPSAFTPPLLWSTSRPNSHPNPNPNQVPANPGLWAGDAARERAAGRAVGRAAGDLPPRLPPEASVGSRPSTRRCDPARRPRPRSRRLRSQVAPAQGDAFRAASAGMALRLCLQTDRPRAFGRSSPTAPRHPRSTLSAPPGHLPVSCVHPSHLSNPTH